MYENLFTVFGDNEPIDDNITQYNDCCLSVDIGEYKAGADIDLIEINTEAGTMTFFDEGNEIMGIWKLIVGVGEKIK